MRPLLFSKRTYLVLWWLIFVFCTVNTAFLLTLAQVYFNYKDATGVLNFLVLIFMYSASAEYLEGNYRLIGTAYAMLAFPFAYGAIHMVISLFRTRKFAFQLTSKPHLGHPRVGLGCFHSVLALHGRHFPIFLMVIETIEVVLQTWQAYRTSKYISNLRVNQLYGILIFINCWSTTIIHYIWEHKRHHSLMARFISVLTDVVLDFVWGVVLQGVLFWRYWSVYVDQSKIGDMLQVPETPDRELRQILVVSVSNFLFSGFPFVTTAIVVHRVRWILHCSQVSSHRIELISPGPTLHPTRTHVVNPQTHIARPTRVVHVKPRESSHTSSTPPANRLWPQYAGIMMVWGTTVLIVAIVASGVFSTSERTYTKCVDRLYPWFILRESYVGREINCTALAIQGNKTDIITVLDTINPYLLGNLAFTDCPGLEIPSAIHNFSGIQTIAIRQSTLVEWDEDAAITDAAFPELQSIQLIESRVHCKPVGMTTHRFPSSFEWLRMTYTNVEEFIHDVEDAWWSTHYFHCIECGLATLPQALNFIDDLVDLELNGNALAFIPAVTMHGESQLRYLVLAENPIANMSAEAWSLVTQLFLLDIQHTNISSIPAEQASRVGSDVAIWAFGTPMCEAENDGTRPPQVTCNEQLRSALWVDE